MQLQFWPPLYPAHVKTKNLMQQYLEKICEIDAWWLQTDSMPQVVVVGGGGALNYAFFRVTAAEVRRRRKLWQIPSSQANGCVKDTSKDRSGVLVN
jgi:hypothetical protein